MRERERERERERNDGRVREGWKMMKVREEERILERERER